MALKGDLKSINLGNVLQDIAGNELTGTLTLTVRDQRRLFWFEKGRLRLVGLGNGKGPSPVNGLLALGKIKATDLNPKGSNVTLVRGLVRRGNVGRDDVKAALEQQMTEHVCDVFVWSDAHFEFSDGDPGEDDFEASQLDHEIRLAADPIIMEALRRVDEWTEIRKSVVSSEEILVVLRDRAMPDSDPTIERVAGMFDGERRLRDIIEQTHLGEFAVFRAAATLLRSGAVRAVTVKEATERAKAAAQKKQFGQALKLARFGLEREPNNSDLHVLAGEALEGLERPDEAASEYRQLAAAQMEGGKRQEAVTTYRRILALAPRDTFAQERLFALLVELGRKSEAMQQGESLAASYKRAGLPDKAKEVYTRIIAAFGDDDDLLEQAAEVARRLGDKKEAIALYRRLFDRALARGDSDAVVLHARTILRLDPSAEDVARRRMEVETGVYRKRQVFRRRIKLFVAGGALLAAITAALTYEIRARGYIGDVRKEAITKRKGAGDLLRMYNRFLDEYGWSLAVAEAKRERNELENTYVDAEFKDLSMEEDRLLASLEVAQRVKDVVRQAETRQRADKVFTDVNRRIGEVGNRRIRESAAWAAAGTPEAMQKIRGLTDPLALQAVQQLAAHENLVVRQSAVVALEKQGSDDALQTLVKRLAAEPDVALKKEVYDVLCRRTGQDFKEDANAWSDWLRKQIVAKGKGAVPSLIATLAVHGRVEAGQPLVLEWRLMNFGGSTLTFTMRHAMEVSAEPKRAMQVRALPGSEPRRVELRPGDFIGGRFDARSVVEGLGGPAKFEFSWTVRVNWGGAGESPIEAMPLKVDVP